MDKIGNFSAANWALEMANKAAIQNPMTAEQSQNQTSNFSTVTWFASMFGTNIAADCTETC